MLAAAATVDGGGGAIDSGGGAIGTGGPAPATSAAGKTVVLYLQRATVESIKPRAPLPVGAGTSLLARSEFAVDCDG